MTRHTTPQTIRIWTYWNDGIVRISIPTNGDTVTLHRGGQTDEGWCSHVEQYWTEDGYLVCEVTDSSSDCDGRHTHHAEFTWHPERDDRQPMRAVDNRGDIIELDETGPIWTRGSVLCRDDYAEAAGY